MPWASPQPMRKPPPKPFDSFAELLRWLDGRRGEELAIITLDPGGWLVSRTRGELTDVLLDDPEQTDSLELRLDSDRHALIIYSSQIEAILPWDDQPELLEDPPGEAIVARRVGDLHLQAGD